MMRGELHACKGSDDAPVLIRCSASTPSGRFEQPMQK